MTGANLTISNSVILPSSLTTITSSATPTLSFSNYSTGIFSLAIGHNITGFTLTTANPRQGGQYVIYITGSGASAYTISNTLSGGTIKTNYTSPITIPISGSAIMTITYAGTTYYIACAVYA